MVLNVLQGVTIEDLLNKNLGEGEAGRMGVAISTSAGRSRAKAGREFVDPRSATPSPGRNTGHPLPKGEGAKPHAATRDVY